MWSYCGSQMQVMGSTFPIMSINLTIDSTNTNPNENLIATLDSLDIGGPATLTYNLLWTYDKRNCP